MEASALSLITPTCEPSTDLRRAIKRGRDPLYLGLRALTAAVMFAHPSFLPISPVEIEKIFRADPPPVPLYLPAGGQVGLEMSLLWLMKNVTAADPRGP